MRFRRERKNSPPPTYSIIGWCLPTYLIMMIETGTYYQVLRWMREIRRSGDQLWYQQQQTSVEPSGQTTVRQAVDSTPLLVPRSKQWHYNFAWRILRILIYLHFIYSEKGNFCISAFTSASLDTVRVWLTAPIFTDRWRDGGGLAIIIIAARQLAGPRS